MRIIGEIKYYSHHQIDKQKWDACILNSANGVIYGSSFFLDHMAYQWDALILDDYEAVMPLTWKKKWGISYLYQPPFTQQLGVFSSKAAPAELLPLFLTQVKQHFRFAEIFLNYQNEQDYLLSKTNFILSLKTEYNAIKSGYRNDAVKNIRRAEKFDLEYGVTDDFKIVNQQYKKLYADRTPHIKERDYYHFEQLCVFAEKKQLLVARQVKDKKGLLACAILLHDSSRLYLLQSATLPAGKIKEANYFLIDNIIKEFSKQPLILDFEGSDIPGIAHFYSNFGAVDQPYYFFRYNNLPWPLRLLKS